MSSKRVAYTAKEKLRIIEYAEEHGNRAAGREYGVAESNIRAWKKNKDTISAMPKTKKANRGACAKFPEMEAELFDWVCDRRERGIGVSTLEIRLTAAKMHKRIYGQTGEQFAASQRWCYSFMKRKELSIRRRTTIAQRLPDDYEDQLMSFQRFVINARKKSDIPPERIGNADQTPLTFDLPYATTVCKKGSSTVSIRTTGNEKNRFTVMLTCLGDGTKLKPYIIFKRKTMPPGKFPKNVVVRVQEKGWMDTALTKDWLKTVWCKRPASHRKSMLVLDSFRCHRDPAIKERLRHDNTDLVIIPGGMTSMLQPLDVGVNKPYKTALRTMWNEWMASDRHNYTKGGRMKKPESVEIAEWIGKAWEELDPQIIVNSFRKCGITNALDGSEDDALWTDERAYDSDTDSIDDILDIEGDRYPDFDFDTSDGEFEGFSDVE